MGRIDADKLLSETVALDGIVKALAEPLVVFLEQCGAVHPREVTRSIVRLELLTAIEDMAMLTVDERTAV